MIKFLTLALTLKLAEPSAPVLKYYPTRPYNYVITNPLLTPVEVKITCGREFEPLILKLSPRSKEELFIKNPLSISDPVCDVDTWRAVK